MGAEDKDRIELKAEQSLLATNSLYYVFRYASKFIIMFITSVLLVRFLGVVNYGIYSLAVVVWALFLLVFSLGIGPTIQYLVAKYRAKKQFGRLDWLLKHYLTILIISTTIGSIIMFLSAQTLAMLFRVPELAKFIEILAIGLVAYAITENFAAPTYIGYQKLRYTFFAGLLYDVLRLVQVSVVVIGLGLLGAITFYDVVYLIMAVISIFFVYKLLSSNKSTIKQTATKPELRKFNRYSTFSYGSALVSYIYGPLITLLLGFFAVNVSAVSFYRVGAFMAGIVGMPAGALAATFFATNTRYFEKRQYDNFYRMLALITKYAVMLTIPLVVGGIVAAGPLLIYFYHSSLLGAETPLIILLLAAVVTSILSPMTGVLSAIGKQRYFMYSNGIAAGIGIVSAVLLLPTFAATGAAIVSLLSSLALVLANLKFVSKYIRISIPFPAVLKSTVASLIMGGYIYFLDLHVKLVFLPLVLISALAIYVALAYVTKLVTKVDIVFFLKLVKLDKFLGLHVG